MGLEHDTLINFILSSSLAGLAWIARVLRFKEDLERMQYIGGAILATVVGFVTAIVLNVIMNIEYPLLLVSSIFAGYYSENAISLIGDKLSDKIGLDFRPEDKEIEKEEK